MDIRKESAQYYDLQPAPYDGLDIPFYVAILAIERSEPSEAGLREARVLELGCGTGRVLVPMSPYCDFIRGIDSSEAMLDVCRQKLAKEGLSPDKAAVQLGDITSLDLGETFDLITAPFRVMQNLETNDQLDGLFETIRRHLAPFGTAVLNAFNPFGPREE